MTFVIAVGSEPEKFEEFRNELCCPNLQIQVEDPSNCSAEWDKYKETIGNAIVSYIREHYFDSDPCENCPMKEDHYDM